MRRLLRDRTVWAVVGVAMLYCLIPMVASADATTFSFTGSVTQTPTFTPGGFDDPFGGAIDFDTPFSGSYTFDAGALDLILASHTGSYQSSGSPFGATVTIGGTTFATTDFIAVNVVDGSPDHYSILACAGGAACPDLRIELVFEDSEGAMVGNDDLPATPPDLVGIEVKQLHLVAFIEGAEIQIDGDITALSASATVPEPGTLLLVGTGLAAALVTGHARRRQLARGVSS